MDPTAPGPVAFPPPYPPVTIVRGTRAELPTPSLRERVETARSQVEDFVRREPLKAMLYAVVAGLAVGRLLKAVGESRKKRRYVIEWDERNRPA
jgi:hypothetical protein